MALNVDEALGAPSGGLHNPWQALGEGALRATGFLAQESACLEAKNYRPALPWQIGQPALITAVHPRRRRVAARARNRCAPGTDENGDAVRLRQNMLDAETVGDHGEEALGHGELNLLRCSPHVLIPGVRCHRHHAKCGRTKLHSAFTALDRVQLRTVATVLFRRKE